MIPLNLLLYFIIILNFFNCNKKEFCSFICNQEENYFLYQFNGWAINPRVNGNQYFMLYSITNNDSINNNREPLFILGIEKKQGSVKSTILDDSKKMIYCREQKIDTSEFTDHVHKVFENFLSYRFNTVSSFNELYHITNDQYEIIYSRKDKLDSQLLHEGYIKITDNCYCKLKE